MMAGRMEKLPKEVRVQICFFRVWCLVEAHKASTMPEMPFIIRAGSYEISESTPGDHIVLIFIGLGEIRADESHRNTEISFIEIIAHVPTELSIFSPLLRRLAVTSFSKISIYF